MNAADIVSGCAYYYFDPVKDAVTCLNCTTPGYVIDHESSWTCIHPLGCQGYDYWNNGNKTYTPYWAAPRSSAYCAPYDSKSLTYLFVMCCSVSPEQWFHSIRNQYLNDPLHLIMIKLRSSSKQISSSAALSSTIVVSIWRALSTLLNPILLLLPNKFISTTFSQNDS